MGDFLIHPENTTPSREAPPQLVGPEAVRAWLEARPRLRPLKISFQHMDGRPAYVLENPGSSAFYKVGEKEFRFLECLDGTQSVADILARQAATWGDSALDGGNALRLLEMLRAEGLLDEPGRPGTPNDGILRPTWVDRFGSLLFWRIPFGDPDRFFMWLSGWLGWVIHPVALLAGLSLMGAGGLALVRHADRMRDATLGVLAPKNWLWIAIIFVILRVIHETWHGLTCRHLGGRVRDVGVVLILFLPMGYTDATSAWGLPSRWHRFLISSAGIYVELCVAAAAALVWANTEPGLVNTLAWQTVLTAGIPSLLFNANPLMRFDGYYMMTDLLDLPNLYTRGQILMRAAFRRYLLGHLDQKIPWIPDRSWRAAAIYGPLALLWRIFIMVNLLAAAAMIFRGAGIALVAVFLLAWARRPMQRVLQWAWKTPVMVQVGAALRILVAAAVVGAVLFIPWRSSAVEPALVDWADSHDVYAGCSGILIAVPVRPGNPVEAGSEVVRIDNPDLEPKADRLRLRMAKEELRERIALRDELIPQWAAARTVREALRDQWEHAVEQARRQIVIAPVSGVMYDHRLEGRVGQYIREGDLLFTLGHPHHREVIALIPQERHAIYGLRVGDPVEVWMPGRSQILIGPIVSLGPAARRRIEQPALTVLGGGHLAVRAPARPGPDDGEGYALHEPHFEVRVRITEPEAISLRAGERGFMRARSSVSLPIGQLAYGWLEHFWSGLLSRR